MTGMRATASASSPAAQVNVITTYARRNCGAAAYNASQRSGSLRSSAAKRFRDQQPRIARHERQAEPGHEDRAGERRNAIDLSLAIGNPGDARERNRGGG